MARRPLSRKQKAVILVWVLRLRATIIMNMCLFMIFILEQIKKPRIKYKLNVVKRLRNVSEFIENDVRCIGQLRMDKHTFHKLCGMIRDIGGLKDTKNMLLEERVALFLNILAHDVKNRMIKHRLKRSQETISRNFHQVLRAILSLHEVLWKTPEPVLENSTDEKWKWFKNCLGALDGIYIRLKVPDNFKSKYRSRKGELATNVLGVCSQDMQFIYVLLGWEGSAADARILRDALNRQNRLRVPHGYYYLVDGGYRNCEGFLAPYRRQCYHLSDWSGGRQPRAYQELFNKRHSVARNVIERCFGCLKMRWKILWNTCCYDINTHADIIIACCLLHNLIRKEMSIDPIEAFLDEYNEMQQNFTQEYNREDYVGSMETSNEWTNFRDNLAIRMFNSWRTNIH